MSPFSQQTCKWLQCSAAAIKFASWWRWLCEQLPNCFVKAMVLLYFNKYYQHGSVAWSRSIIAERVSWQSSSDGGILSLAVWHWPFSFSYFPLSFIFWYFSFLAFFPLSVFFFFLWLWLCDEHMNFCLGNVSLIPALLEGLWSCWMRAGETRLFLGGAAYVLTLFKIGPFVDYVRGVVVGLIESLMYSCAGWRQLIAPVRT